MCWAHVYRAISPKIPDKAILADIEKLQISFSTKLFDYNYELFLKKWKMKNKLDITEFLTYFDKEWIKSTNKGWFEGYTDGQIPSTTNG